MTHRSAGAVWLALALFSAAACSSFSPADARDAEDEDAGTSTLHGPGSPSTLEDGGRADQTTPDAARADGGPTAPSNDTIPTYANGTFETQLEAAFDGVTDQTASQAARAALYENLDEPPLLFREYGCERTLTSLVVHPPSDGPFLHDPTHYPNGGLGTVTVVGRRAGSSSWTKLLQLPFDPDSGPIAFDPVELAKSTTYVAYGVRFASDQPQPSTIRVAEVEMTGYCAGPTAQIEWSTSDWVCSGVECLAESNPGGVLRRSVACARSTGGTASEAMCAGEKPAASGDTCTLSCAHHLVYIGARPFTYDNGSGWLHEGGPTQRTGPLPHAVEHGTTRQAIEGKPCSIRTENPSAYFVGISCQEPSDAGAMYCAFRCE